MLRYVFLLIINLLIISINAQSVGLAYGYDVAGNRISRIVVDEPQLQSPRYGAPPSHQLNDVFVSPTITTDEVTITTTYDLNNSVLPWTLADIQGRIIKRGRMELQSMSLTIDGEPGTYLINLITPDGPVTFRIMKQ